ncbi:13281_t:CDS:1, partial [Cetraspora pellucida]
DDIELLATSNVHTEAIINVLTHKYPDKYFYMHNVYNIVQIIKAEKGMLSNTEAAYKELMQKKQE